MEWIKAKNAHDLLNKRFELVELSGKLQEVMDKDTIIGFVCVQKNPGSFADLVSCTDYKKSFAGLPFDKYIERAIRYMDNEINKEIGEIDKQIEQL